MFPQARQDKLLVREMGDEVVVYDLERHRAHCLTRTTALIWRLCDGQTTVAELTGRVEQELKSKVDEEVVWLVLNRLEQAHLLRELLLRPCEIAGISRRQAISVGLAGAASLLLNACGVESVTTPTPVSEASSPNVSAVLEGAQQVGRTVTVEVKDQNGNACNNVTVELADVCTFVPPTLHRKPMCVSRHKRKHITDRAGTAEFRQVVPNQYELCVCGGYNCRLAQPPIPTPPTSCAPECKGDLRRITVPPVPQPPAPVPTQMFVLEDCKCKK